MVKNYISNVGKKLHTAINWEVLIEAGKLGLDISENVRTYLKVNANAPGVPPDYLKKGQSMPQTYTFALVGSIPLPLRI